MAIEFHCPYCNKQIRTSEEHGGRHGKCPACHQSVYIPTAPEKIEPLKLEPVDESFAREQARLLRETRELQRRLLTERELPGEARGAAAGRPAATGGTVPAPSGPPVDVESLVYEYVICMADGELEEAGELAGQIRRHMKQADDVIQRLVADEIPPAQLARVPRPVLMGFLKQLREK